MKYKSSSFRFLIGSSTDCGTVSATGVFNVFDADSSCSSRDDLPQFVFSNNLDATLTVDGGFTIWSLWSDCSKTCDEGTQTRTRSCTDPSPQYGGVDCVGDTTEEHICVVVYCPIDGGFANWDIWSDCSQTCDEGIQTRTRTCTDPSPQYGGADCFGSDTDEQSCLLVYCPIDGGLASWMEWGVCSHTCDEGTQSRARTCSDPIPQYGGADCVGDTIEEQTCLVAYCPINGDFSNWNDWTDCSQTCDEGIQTRTRTCTEPSPQYGGADCLGDTTEDQTCLVAYCPSFSTWSEWGDCSQSCNEGIRSRTRTCTEPIPQYGGADCVGDTMEEQICLDSNCPVNGGYTSWSEWSGCSVTCGDGTSTRSRDCTNPAPQHGGEHCASPSVETKLCNEGTCPVDWNWSVWTSWSICTLTCGTGSRSRSRTCIPPQYGGEDCPIEDFLEETEYCNTLQCPVDGALFISEVDEEN
ncbi:hypothetical protein ACF0H5_003048 [Mactra antiquata]